MASRTQPVRLACLWLWSMLQTSAHERPPSLGLHPATTASSELDFKGFVRCAGNVLAKGGQWPPNGGSWTGLKVALNQAQILNGKAWGNTEMCGKMLMVRGTGGGLGLTPVSKSWQVRYRSCTLHRRGRHLLEHNALHAILQGNLGAVTSEVAHSFHMVSQLAMVTNMCPECKYGSLDFGTSGDGR